MKRSELFQFITPKFTALFLVLTIISGTSLAGDVKVIPKFMYRLVHESREQPITAEIENIENYPVNGVNFSITIKHKLSLDIAYQWQTNLGTIDPKSKQTVEADPWLNPMIGNFNVLYQLTSLNDINPTNDTYSYDLEVMPMPYFDFDFFQFNFLNPIVQENSTTGRVDFTVPPSNTTQFVNFMFALPNTSTTPQWLIQNVPLPAFSETQQVSYWIDLEKLGAVDAQGVPYLLYNFQVGANPVLAPFPSDDMFLSKVGKDIYDVGGDNSLEEEFPYTQSTYTPTIDWGDGEWRVKTWNYRGCKVSNIDLDSSTYNPRDMTGEVGDWNACGPAAAVNSLQWLEDSMKNIPKTNTTLREKISIYNKLSGRSNESGMKAGELIEGKLAFIDSFKLPIRVKWQGYPYFDSVPSPNPKYKHLARHKNDSMWAKAKWDWLVDEMEHGEDVEILFGWHDSTNHRHGGHWVVVTGVSDVNIAKGIYVKDDGNQGAPGGTRQTYVNWVTNDEGRSRLVGFKARNNYCWVESVVSESYDSTVTFGVDKPKVKQIDNKNTFDPWEGLKGLFEFTYTPADYNRFLNLFARMPGETNPVWIARNLLLPPFDTNQDLSVWFDFGWLGFEAGNDIDEIEYGYEVTDYIEDWADKIFEGLLKTISVEKVTYLKPVNDEDKITRDIPEFHSVLEEISYGSKIEYHYRGCEVPNLDLDSSKYNPTTVAGYAGDKNACGPVGAANSMQWLDNKFDQIDSKTTHRGKLTELSKMMERANNGGVYTDKFIKGKLAFIDKHKLPIKVKFQSYKMGTDSIPSPNAKYGHYAHNMNDSANADPTFEWLLNEMKDKEDVELEWGYYDTTGTRHGGHWVTVSGVSDVGTARGLYFKDDINQRDTGGTRQQYVNWVLSKSGEPYLPQVSTSKYAAMVESVVSESYDSTITFDVQKPKVERIRFDIGSFFDIFFDITPSKGLLTVDVLPESHPRYLNVRMRDPSGGSGSPDNDDWVVRNALLAPFEDTDQISFWFDFAQFGISGDDLISGTNEVDVAIEVSEDILSRAELGEPLWHRIVIEAVDYIQSLNNDENDVEDILPIAPITLIDDFGAQKTWHYRGNNVPNIDLDSSKYNHTTVEGYAGDKNACGPAAAANSMQWLDNTHPKLQSNTTHRKKLEELSKMMNRANNAGVFRKDLIKAKLEFIDKYKLPIHVKFQGWKFGTDSIPSPNATYGHYAENKNDTARAKPQWDWLVEEMEKGEDVELEYGYYDTTGVRRRGHWVTVTGVSENEHYKGFYFKDDLNQRDSSGMRQQYVNWKMAFGYPYLVQNSGRKYTCYVETIVSESYDSTITFNNSGADNLNLVNELELSVYENPSSVDQSITIAYNLPEPGEAEIRIFDLRGNTIYIREDFYNAPGRKTVIWNGQTNYGNRAKAGTYIVSVKAHGKESAIKIIRK